MAEPSGYGYYKEVTIQDANIDSLLTDFPGLVKIVDDGDIGTYIDDDVAGYDIRFYDVDTDTEIPYERVYFDVTTEVCNAIFWVKVPYLYSSPTGNENKIRIYFGKVGDSDGEDAQNVWDGNYKQVSHLNEASGTLYDSTGNNHDSTSENIYAYQEVGAIHYACEFDPDDAGAPYYIQGANHADFAIGTGPLTVEAWGNSNQFDYWATLFRKRSGEGWAMYLYEDGTDMRIELIDGASNDRIKGGVHDSGNWHLWVNVRDATGLHIGYKDDSRTEGGDFDNDLTSGTEWYIGASGITGTAPWDGYIEEYRFSDIERTQDWLNFQFHNINEADNELTWGALVVIGGVTHELIGEISFDNTYVGALSAIWELVGSISFDNTFTGVLSAIYSVISEISFDNTYTGALSAIWGLVGDISFDNTYVGELERIMELVGDLDVKKPTFVADLSGIFGLLGDLDIAQPELTGALSAIWELVGDLDISQPQFSGTLERIIELLGDLDIAQPQLTGDIVVGVIHELIGLLDIAQPELTGALSAIYGLTGDLDVKKPTFVGDLTGIFGLVGSIVAQVDFIGGLSAIYGLVGAMNVKKPTFTGVLGRIASVIGSLFFNFNLTGDAEIMSSDTEIVHLTSAVGARQVNLTSGLGKRTENLTSVVGKRQEDLTSGIVTEEVT